jgi:hypothetical protein
MKPNMHHEKLLGFVPQPNLRKLTFACVPEPAVQFCELVARKRKVMAGKGRFASAQF